MSVAIAGMGWVTPLGRGIDEVWERLLRGDEATAQPICSAGKQSYQGFLVPTEALKLPPHPRLRRASAISRFAVAAGLDAIAATTSVTVEIDTDRLGLVFAVSNGGVTYTRRFYHSIVESGPQSASTLLFPETVFNAPASHLAAILGINGASYTVVGDGAVGILGIKMAADLVESGAVEQCLVVAAEEADWILCDAYHKWRLTTSSPQIELFSDPPRGTILSEGAGAVMLSANGKIKIDAVSAGGNFSYQREAVLILDQILNELGDRNEFIIGGANGTFVDLAERDAIRKQPSRAIVYSPKPALGESVGASALWQVIIGACAVTRKQLPVMRHTRMDTEPELLTAGEVGSAATVLSCGLNQQAAGLRLSV